MARKSEKVLAGPPTRRRRAAFFQSYVVVGSLLFAALAVTAHFIPYFPIDLAITRALQSHHDMITDRLLRATSWIGFEPQVEILGTSVVLLLFAFGLRWEAVGAVFAGLNPLVGNLIKLAVTRPRPSADLVHVVSRLDTTGFPSGHVLAVTSFGGYLVFLAYTLLQPSWYRTAGMVLLSLIVVLMGPSRIYLGHHWFSDVMGAYLFASVWLGLTIGFYRWGKPRFFRGPRTPQGGVSV